MAHKSLQSFFCLLLLITLIATGCSGGVGLNSGAARDEWGYLTVDSGQVEVVMLLDLPQEMLAQGAAAAQPRAEHGSDAVYIDQWRGALLALEEVQRVRNVEIALRPVSVDCDEPGQIEQITLDALGSASAAVIASGCSAVCEQALPVAQQQQVSMVATGCASSELIGQNLRSPWFVSIGLPLAAKGEAAADYAYNELGDRSVVTVSDTSLEAEEQIDAFETRFLQLGGAIVAELTLDDAPESAWRSIEEANPDLIYAPIAPEAGAALLEAQSSMLPQVPLLFGEASQTDWFGNRLSRENGPAYALGIFQDELLIAELEAAYTSAYGEAPHSGAYLLGYDAALVVLRALQTSATAGGLGRSELFGRQAVHNAIMNTAALQGATGAITCTSNGECSAGLLNIARWEPTAEAWVPVYRINLFLAR